MKPELRLAGVLSFLTAILVCSCQKSVLTDVPVEDIVLSSSSLELTAGQSAVLAATVRPATATDCSILWSSTKESVAKVDAEGKVTAVSQGHAYIVAKNASSGVKASCLVKVNAVPGYNVIVKMEDGTPVEETMFAYPGMSVRLSASSDDTMEHRFGWEASGELSVENGLLNVGIGNLTRADGYLHLSRQNVKAVSEDGFFNEFTVVSNVSSTFRFGNADYAAGCRISLGDGKRVAVSLLWNDGTDVLRTLPASSYTLISSDEQLVSCVLSDEGWQVVSAAGRTGDVQLSVKFGNVQTGLCAASVAIDPDYGGSIEELPYEEYVE